MCAGIAIRAGVREKRRAPRIPLETAVTVRRGELLATGETTDISDGGLRLATVCLLTEGTKVELTWRLREGEFRSQALVRQSDGETVAFEFIEPPRDTLRAIGRLVDQRLLSWG